MHPSDTVNSYEVQSQECADGTEVLFAGDAHLNKGPTMGSISLNPLR
jgi:hypothetical protein